MNQEDKKLDLAYFQQQVAEKYYRSSIDNLFDAEKDEAAELYAEHRFLQGKQEGEAKIAELSASLYKQGKRNGWNEAVEEALNEIQFLNIPKYVSDRIKSLKQEGA